MKPDKKLGQHFLRDAAILEEIAALTDVRSAVGDVDLGEGRVALAGDDGEARRLARVDLDRVDPVPRRVHTRVRHCQREHRRVRRWLGDAWRALAASRSKRSF